MIIFVWAENPWKSLAMIGHANWETSSFWFRPLQLWCGVFWSLKRHVGALGAGAISRAALVCQVPTPGNTWGKPAWTGSTCQKLQHLNCLLLIRPVTTGWGSIPASMHLLGAHLASSSPPVVSRWSSTVQTCHLLRGFGSCSALSFVPQRKWRFLDVPHKILCHWYWPETSRFPCLDKNHACFWQSAQNFLWFCRPIHGLGWHLRCWFLSVSGKNAPQEVQTNYIARVWHHL